LKRLALVWQLSAILGIEFVLLYTLWVFRGYVVIVEAKASKAWNVCTSSSGASAEPSEKCDQVANAIRQSFDYQSSLVTPLLQSIGWTALGCCAVAAVYWMTRQFRRGTSVSKGQI